MNFVLDTSCCFYFFINGPDPIKCQPKQVPTKKLLNKFLHKHPGHTDSQLWQIHIIRLLMS